MLVTILSGAGGGMAGAPPVFTITGEVLDEADAAVEGVTITLTGAAEDSTTTDAEGLYELIDVAIGSYTVTPTKTGEVFTPTDRAVEVTTANQTADFAQNFTIPATINWESDTIGQSPTSTPMYSDETSTVRAIVQANSKPVVLTKMVETITAEGTDIHNWRSPYKVDISAGIRIEVLGIFPAGANEDFYVGLAGNTTAHSGASGLPDYHVMAMFREDDNDFYQRQSRSEIVEWADVNQVDLGFNMTPQTWNHYQVEYKPAADELLAQYRQLWTSSAGGFKTLALSGNWNKPDLAYVIWGGLNNAASFVRVANVWIGALTDAWPYVGA